MIKKLISFVTYKIKTRTNEGKRKYLRSLGAKVGDKTRFNCDVLSFIGSEPYLVEIGEDCLFAGGCHLTTHDGGVKVLNALNYFERNNDKIGRIKIGNNVYFGMNTIVLPNVKIGNNVIIGANSVVSRNIPDNSVAVGQPAKVICSIEEYFQKNKSRNVFYQTAGLVNKKELLEKIVPKLD